MFLRLFFAVCFAFTFASIGAKTLNKWHEFGRRTTSCDSGRVKCPNSDRCIREEWFCDGDDDCGDNSDETDARCSRACSEEELTCSNGACLDKMRYCRTLSRCQDGTQFTDVTCPHIDCEAGKVKCAYLTKCIRASYVCDGDDDCGDGSDEEPGNCRSSELPPPRPQPEPEPAPEMPSAEEMVCFMALSHIWQTCGEMPAALKEGTTNPREIVHKIVEMDMQELCSITRTWYECQRDLFEPCASLENGMLADMQQIMTVAETALNYVCVQEIEVFSRNKACLLRGNNEDFILGQGLQVSCMHLAQQYEATAANPMCIPDDILGCGKDVVAAQCGDEVAGAVVGLVNIVMESVDCEDSRARSLPYSRKQRKAVRQMAPSNDEEMRCMMAVMSASQVCGDGPTRENPQELYTMLVNSDIQELCSRVQPWHGCMTNVFTSCENVDNPMIMEPKRMLALTGTALNYVCVQHADVINRHKACLLRPSSAASHRHLPMPEIALKVPTSCSHLFQPGPGNPVCMVNTTLQGCVKNVVAQQCGDEIANTLYGLTSAMYTEAGCPSRSAKKSFEATWMKRAGLLLRKTD